MEAKKILGTILTLFGGLGLVAGVFGIFEGGQIAGVSAYAWAIVGGIFFLSGIGLMKSVGPATTTTTTTQRPNY